MSITSNLFLTGLLSLTIILTLLFRKSITRQNVFLIIINTVFLLFSGIGGIVLLAVTCIIDFLFVRLIQRDNTSKKAKALFVVALILNIAPLLFYKYTGLALFILFGLLFVLCSRDLFKNMSTVQFLFITLLIIGAIVFVYYFLLPNAENTDLYQRVFGRKAEKAETSDEIRINYYWIALEDFKDNLLTGLGFDNFKYVHHNYTHSTYVQSVL